MQVFVLVDSVKSGSPSVSIKSTELRIEGLEISLVTRYVKSALFCIASQQLDDDEQYPPLEYYAQVYYIPRETNSWGMKFNVTKSLNAFISVIQLIY